MRSGEEYVAYIVVVSAFKHKHSQKKKCKQGLAYHLRAHCGSCCDGSDHLLRNGNHLLRNREASVTQGGGWAHRFFRLAIVKTTFLQLMQKSKGMFFFVVAAAALLGAAG